MPDRFPDRLKQGYNTFRTDAFPRERQRYDALAADGQKPTIMIIACCDSRAAPEIVFDASPGEVFVVRNVAVDYHQPARLDDALTATAGLAKLGGASMVMHQRVLRGDEVLASGDVTIACVDQRTLKPKRIPAAMMACLRG